jgi:hypothetical protein
MQIPGLGNVVEDADLDWYRSEAIPVSVLGGAPCRFVVDGYDADPAPEDFQAAIRTFLSLDRSALTAAAPSIFAYYRDIMDDVVAAGDDDWYVEIGDPHDVFDHIRLGNEPTVARDASSDRHVYVSLECECEWEPEHGLQIVFRDGRTVTKVGPYDGHLTNSAAHADDRLDGVVYHSSHSRSE